jgi:cullin 3
MSNTKGVNGEEVDFDSTWNVLETAFTDIHKQNASSLSYEELYRFAYRLVLKKQGEKLYENVKTFEAGWLQTKVLPRILSHLSTALQSGQQDGSAVGIGAGANERRDAGEKFLVSLKSSWNEHVLAMNMLADVLMYMVRIYLSFSGRRG